MYTLKKRRIEKMKNIQKKIFFPISILLLFINGCQTTSSNDLISGSDNIFGDPLVIDTPLNQIDGVPIDGDRSLFQPIYFSYDSSAISPDQAAICEGVAKHLKQGGGVIVEGHGDERGSREYNLALGERRAIAVRHYLIELGVNPSQIQTKSFGEENPAIGDRHDEEAWSKNRRVEFAIY
jgi:peptidoglycan-associated lipoprotein